MTTAIELTNSRFFSEFYEKHLRETSKLPREHSLVQNATQFFVERRGGSWIWKVYNWNNTYDAESSFKALLAKASQITDTNEFLAASKTCFVMRKFILTVMTSKTVPINLKRLREDFRAQGITLIEKLAVQEGSSALVTACKYGMFPQAIHFLENARNIFDAQPHFTQLLQAAFKKKKFDICLNLIENGAGLGNLTKADLTILLREALIAGKPRTAATIIQAGPDYAIPVGSAGELVLHIACHETLTDTVKLMVQKGAEPNGLDAKGNSALHKACEKLQSDTALFLVANGARVSQVNTDGYTPFQLPLKMPNEMPVKQFYSRLYKHIPNAEKEISQNGVTTFLDRCQSFEVALLMHDEKIAKRIARGQTKQEFFASLSRLREKFPTTDTSLIEFCHLDLSPLEIQPCKYPPTPQETVELQKEILTLFEKVDFANDQKRKLTQKQSLDQFLAHIAGRVELASTPKKGDRALEEFYLDIENCLKQVVLAFKHSQVSSDELTAFFAEIVQATNSKSGAWYYFTAISQYQKLCKRRPNTFVEEIFQLLLDYRRQLIQSLFVQQKDVMVKQYNYLIRNLGKQLALPEAFVTYVDALSFADIVPFKQKFFKLYNPKTIQRDLIEPKLAQDSGFKARFIDWRGSSDVSPLAVTKALSSLNIVTSNKL